MAADTGHAHCVAGRFVTVRSNRTHSFVETDGDHTLRIRFRTASVALSPSITKTLAVLRNFVTIEDDRSPLDREWHELDGAERDHLVRQLASGGQQVEAVAMLCRRKGMSTTDAKQFVDTLRQ